MFSIRAYAIVLSLVSSCLIGASTDHEITLPPGARPRVIQILPLADATDLSSTTKPGSIPNALGERGDGTTFKSFLPHLVALVDSCPTFLPGLQLVLQAGTGNVSSNTPYYFNIVKSLTQYALLELPSRSGEEKEADQRTLGDVRNPLVVTLECLNSRGECIAPPIAFGIFVSGNDSYHFMDSGGRCIDIHAPTKQVVETCLKPLQVAPHLRKRSRDGLTQLLASCCSEYKIDEEQESSRREYFSTSTLWAYPQSRFKTPLITIRSLNSHQESSDTLHFVQVIKRLIEDDLFVRAKKFADQTDKKHEKNKAITVDTRYAMYVPRFCYPIKETVEEECRTLFCARALDNEKGNGCLDSDFSSCFMDSEQTFLNWTGGDMNVPKAAVLTDIFRSTADATCTQVEKIRWNLLSPRDICRYCRGTMSKAIKRGWFKLRAEALLGGSLDCSRVREVEVYAHTLYPITDRK